MRVLVVEDERNLADAIARGLRQQGMAVDVAYDGDAGHEMAFVTRYDVVVLDRDLPGVHGDQICADLVGLRRADPGADAHRERHRRRPGGGAAARRGRLPAQAVRLRRAGRPGAGAGPAGHPGRAAGARTGRPGARPGPPGGHPRRCAAGPDPQGVRRAGGAAQGARRGGVQRGTAGTGLGRQHRPVHHDRPGHRDDAAQEARRPAADRDGGRRRATGGRRRTASERCERRSRPSRPWPAAPDPAAAADPAQRGAADRGRSDPGAAGLAAGRATRCDPPTSCVPGTIVLLSDGREMDAAAVAAAVVDAASGELLAKGLVALLAISVVGVAGAYAVAGRALRPLHQVTATAQRLGEATLDQRIGYSGADDEVAELAEHVRRHAGPDRVRVRGAETLRGQRLARAAYPARRDAYRDRRDAQRRRRGRRRVPPDGDRRPRRLRAGQRPGRRAAGAGPQRGAGRAAAGPAVPRRPRRRAPPTRCRRCAARWTGSACGCRRRWSRRRSSATRGCWTGWPAT